MTALTVGAPSMDSAMVGLDWMAVRTSWTIWSSVVAGGGDLDGVEDGVLEAVGELEAGLDGGDGDGGVHPGFEVGVLLVDFVFVAGVDRVDGGEDGGRERGCSRLRV